MDFCVLGPTLVMDRGSIINVGGTKQRTVLASLLLAHSAMVPCHRIARMLWGDHPPSTDVAQVHTYIYKLRKSCGVGADIVRQGDGYCLNLRDASLDVDEFMRRVATARGCRAVGRDVEAAGQLRDALGLWRGPAVADVTEQLASVERPGLEDLRLETMEELIDIELDQDHQRLTSTLFRLVAEHPLRERLRAQLMVCLYRCDRRAEALAAYRDGREILAETAGIDPGPELQQLHAAILNDEQTLSLKPPDRYDRLKANPRLIEPADSPAAPRSVRLPPATTPLIGRDAEAATIVTALERANAGPAIRVPICLVTGTAGAGKTSLAVAVAHRVKQHYTDGQFYIDLQASTGRPLEAGEALVRLLNSMGVDPGIQPSLDRCIDRYREETSSRSVLVVLDDAASSAQVRPLIPVGDECGAIVAARNASATSLDWVAAVKLDIPDEDHAIDLLVSILGEDQVQADLQDAQRIVRLCGYLPLAVSIAGARLRARPHWSLGHLAARLGRVGTRLDELEVGDRSVRRSIEGSMSRLSEQQRTTLATLSWLDVPYLTGRLVAAAICVDTDRADVLIESLVDEGLLYSVPPPVVNQCLTYHYAFHELAREVAREQKFGDGPEFTNSLQRSVNAAIELADQTNEQCEGRSRTQSTLRASVPVAHARPRSPGSTPPAAHRVDQ